MLSHNPTQLDSYNKHAKQGQGTLIANWYEERVHRQTHGEGRAATRTHFPRQNKTLHQSTGFKSDRVQDDTKYRILGDTSYGLGKTQNYHYGKGVNKAEQFPKTGKKQQMIEQMYLKSITESVLEQQKRQQQEARKGTFQTTNKATYTSKPLTQNVIGRLVMYDQNARKVDLSAVDEDLRQAHGFLKRGQITPDEQLKKLIDSDVGYQKQQPVTYWRQKIDDGTYYMSKPGATQCFGKNNEFLKTFKSYKHYND